MKILHTADWHLGQLFYEYDRTYEHQLFLNRFPETLVSKKIDALFLSGVVFDLPNPSLASVKTFYSFLNHSRKIGPFKKEYGNPYLFRNIMTDICSLQSGKAGAGKPESTTERYCYIDTRRTGSAGAAKINYGI